jgi:branched-chain amino acid transport system permease protein
VLASPVYFTSWESGLALGLKGFVAATLGGLVSGARRGPRRARAGRPRDADRGYVSTGLRDAVAFLLLIVVLVVRPGGIFGRHAEARV